MTVSRRNKHMYRVTKNENLQQNCMSRHLCLDSFHRIAVHTYSYLNYYLSFDVCVCFRLSCLSAKKKLPYGFTYQKMLYTKLSHFKKG